MLKAYEVELQWLSGASYVLAEKTDISIGRSAWAMCNYNDDKTETRITTRTSHEQFHEQQCGTTGLKEASWKHNLTNNNVEPQRGKKQYERTISRADNLTQRLQESKLRIWGGEASHSSYFWFSGYPLRPEQLQMHTRHWVLSSTRSIQKDECTLHTAHSDQLESSDGNAHCTLHTQFN